MWCAVRVDRALMAVDGVESTQLQFAAGRLTVNYDAADTEPGSLIRALEAAGYGAEREGTALPSSERSSPSEQP